MCSRDRVLASAGCGELGRGREEVRERGVVAHQVPDRFLLRGLVLLGQADRVVDEEADVVAPQEPAVEELRPGLVAVDRCRSPRTGRRRSRRASRRSRRSLLAAVALLRGEHREQRVLAEELVERDPQIDGRARHAGRVGVVVPMSSVDVPPAPVEDDELPPPQPVKATTVAVARSASTSILAARTLDHLHRIDCLTGVVRPGPARVRFRWSAR